ncbi:MAG TPA: glycosyltransferase [Acetobacteraceae bacterium]|nr:glycosyltransferase [Acetobacteraceae bacterium]
MSVIKERPGLGPLHRAWRLLPPAARRKGARALSMALAPRRDAAPPARSAGVAVAGEMGRVSGLGEAARLLHAGCAAAGADRGAVTLGLLRAPAPPVPRDAALILHANAPVIPLMLARAPRNFLRGRRVIGFWNWELPILPEEWRAGSAYVHEIWTPSAFTKAALEGMFPGLVRLVPYPLAALPLPPADPGRAALGLPGDAVVTSVIANLGASFARKNPLGAIAAHRLAFGGRQDRILVLKLAGGAAFPADLARVTAAIGDSPNIRLIDEVWPGSRIHGLIAASDMVLSLHRAEGFGLVPAEAMLRGVPVVATGWSGNLQFMDPESAGLVPYRLAPVEDERGDYALPGAVWAEPDTGAAASLLRALADDPARRAALGGRGRDHAMSALGAGPLLAALDAAGIAH